MRNANLTLVRLRKNLKQRLKTYSEYDHLNEWERGRRFATRELLRYLDKKKARL